MEIADLVTEVKEIKHPYRQGASARKGRILRSNFLIWYTALLVSIENGPVFFFRILIEYGNCLEK